ncbi:MAG TPA: sodium:solute symporter [Blastocatellia bacterium]|nr:sodium:solute symporter [Blastocatellia bacterium]
MRTGDWFVFTIYLALTLFIGLWKSRKGRNIEAYFLGNRSIPWWAVGLSVMATQASAITFIGTTGQAFADGMRFIQMYLPLPFVVVILCLSFVPFFYRAKVYTAYEYLERRFDIKTRALTSFLFQCSRGMSVGIVVYAPSVVLSIMLGWDERLTILMMGLSTLIYTSIGGVRAVVWTDTMQMLLMFAGVFVGLYLVISKLPEGVTMNDAVYLAGVAKRWNAINVSANLNDQYSLLSGLVGGFFLMLSYFGCDQSQVQRFITAESLKESRMSLVMTGILKVPMQFLILATGVFLLVFYQFERPPVYFNPVEVRRLEESPRREQILQTQREFDQAFDRQRDLGLRLLDARRNGDHPAAEQLVAEYEASNKRVQEIRKATSDMVEESSGTKTDANYVYLNFLFKYVPAGLLGLMISVIFAAAMSSISGEIAALSSASMVDYYKRFFKRDASDLHYLRAAQVWTVFWGIFATLIAALVGRRGTSLVETVNKVGSHFYGPILGVFLLAFFVKRANGHGAFFGVILGMIAVIYVSWMTDVSWLYLNVVGPVVVVTTGTLISLFFSRGAAKKSPEISPRH